MTMTETVRAIFEKEGWKYAEENGWFESAVMLRSEIEGALIHIDTNDDALVIMTALDYDIPESAFDQVLSFANALNMVVPMGCMYLDTVEHMLVFKLGNVYGENVPAQEDAAERLYFCLDITERTADILTRLAEDALSLEEAIDHILRPEGE